MSVKPNKPAAGQRGSRRFIPFGHPWPGVPERDRQANDDGFLG